MVYEAIVVLGGGLFKKGDDFYPTDYSPEAADQYGMYGGAMRIVAATVLCVGGMADTFVFTTGRAPSMVARFGTDIPTEAELYAEHFSRMLSVVGQQNVPWVILEDVSTSTFTNIQNVFRIVRREGWKKLAVLTSRYHLPRTQALYSAALASCAIADFYPEIDFLSAEEIVIAAMPDRYDAKIAAAYESEVGRIRIASEQKGLDDLAAGRYSLPVIFLD